MRSSSAVGRKNGASTSQRGKYFRGIVFLSSFFATLAFFLLVRAEVIHGLEKLTAKTTTGEAAGIGLLLGAVVLLGWAFGAGWLSTSRFKPQRDEKTPKKAHAQNNPSEVENILEWIANFLLGRPKS